LFSESLENRVVEKLRKDDLIANAMVGKIDQSPALRTLTETVHKYPTSKAMMFIASRKIPA
jgi:hypothetical protein